MRTLALVSLLFVMGCNEVESPTEPQPRQVPAEYDFTFDRYLRIDGHGYYAVAGGEITNHGREVVLIPQLKLYYSLEKRSQDVPDIVATGNLGIFFTIYDPTLGLRETRTSIRPGETLHFYVRTETFVPPPYASNLYYRFSFIQR